MFRFLYSSGLRERKKLLYTRELLQRSIRSCMTLLEMMGDCVEREIESGGISLSFSADKIFADLT